MLASSYAAVQQFQSQIFSAKNFQELKKLSMSLGISVSTQISSSTVWIAYYDLTRKNLHGTIEIAIQPKLSIKSDVFETRHPRTFRLETPTPITWGSLEYRFLDLMKQSILSISDS